MHSETIIYEQPLNEHIRVCLRLEYLFAKIDNRLNQTSCWDSREALLTTLEILDVIDRPDIKSKLTNALRQHEAALTHLECAPDINRAKLHEILYKLKNARELLHNIHGKLGQELRENEFLSSIRQRMTTAAGACNFANPALQLWLHQTSIHQNDDLRLWITNFSEIRNIIELILKLTRESSAPAIKIAYSGFYQEALSAGIPHQLIRVEVPKIHNHYPEVSVGRHRLSIHFYTLNVQERPAQVHNDLEFILTCCKI